MIGNINGGQKLTQGLFATLAALRQRNDTEAP
jgi:hypothetical protein